jgi:hypothetical protein
MEKGHGGEMSVYRCDWCGRFYSSPLPEGSACDNHIPEHNERLTAQIARHNEKVGRRGLVEGFAASSRKPKTHAEEGR